MEGKKLMRNSGADIMAGISGKIPPQAGEIEAAALGAMMVDAACIETGVSLLSAEMFYAEENRPVFSAIAELHRENMPVDILTVAQKLKVNGTLESVGGPFRLTQLSSTVGSGAHIEYHCKIILQKYIMRRLIAAGNETVKTGFDETIDAGDAIAAAERQIADIADIVAGRRQIKNFDSIIETSMDDVYRRAAAVKEGRTGGIRTGLSELDTKVQGWGKSNLIILAGRPGQGKSALMLHFAKTAARANVPVVIFALEMSAVSLVDRMLLSFCDVPAHKFRSGYVSRDELNGLESAAEQLRRLPITIDDTPTVSMSQIRAKARALARRGKCGMVFIDYLQLIKMDLSQGKNVNNAIAEISREAKILAKEINVPVMLLSQLNRETERRTDKRPQLSDLRDSGAIEQDADIVMFVYRPAYYGIETSSLAGENSGLLIISKFREGAVGDVPFSHNRSLTQIYNFGIADVTEGEQTQTEIQAGIPF
jgi:replicative DNA helicase